MDVGQTMSKRLALRGSRRPGHANVLDAGSTHPVKVSFIAMNRNGTKTTNENDLSLVAVVQFDGFCAEIGGDLSGFENSSYKDIETSVAPMVGEIGVYKVHHHCSAYSTSDNWLNTTSRHGCGERCRRE